MNQKRTKDVLKHLSSKYNIPIWAITEMVEAQYDLLRRTAESGSKEDGNFKNVRLYKMGLFYVSPGKIKFFKSYYEEKKRTKTDIKDSNEGGAKTC